MKTYLYIFVFCLWPLGLFAQVQVQTLDSIPAQKKGVYSSNLRYIKESKSQIVFSGFYRFLGYVRNQSETFPNNSGKTTVISVGDFFREPMLKLRLNGSTKENISWGVDFMINSMYKGPSPDFTQNLSLDMGLNFRSVFKTPLGLFTFRSGGVAWYRQSRLTVWGNQSFNRTSIYSRRPQTPMGKSSVDRYNQFFEKGLIDQGARYGSRAFQGLFLDARKLPLDFWLKGVIGKSNFNRSFPATLDNFTGCFQLGREFMGGEKLAYNYLSSVADIDTLSSLERKYSIHSLEFRKNAPKVLVEFEAALGKYEDPDSDLGVGEALLLKVRTRSKWPLIVQAYRVSPQFVNVTGNLLNTSVLEVFPDVAGIGATIRSPYKSPMVGLGFPVNNRQGISLNTDIDLGKLKINGGIGVYTDIDASISELSYIHNVVGEVISRLYLFQQNWGPYNSLNSTYRRSFEEVIIDGTDQTGLADFKKYFNTIELQMKYRNKMFGRTFHVFSLTRVNTCREDFRIFPELNLNSILSQASQEIDLSVELKDKVVLVASYGIERVVGNERTDIGDTGASTSTNLFLEWLGFENGSEQTVARNQRNRLLGLGLDYQISNQVGFFIRQNFYRYFDPNFLENNLKGTETMLELKVTF